MRNEDSKICYLKLVFPFTIIYMSILFVIQFINFGMTSNTILDVILITITAFSFAYGVLAIIRDLKEFSTFETLKYWWRKIVGK